ncbi:MAG TPA: ElyC/SanA/YdcF family protein [Candidatus Sulfotelmatobacter sp.]|nr:ElyC/SanA/YdcF family protein [Candidatus Sulfotelmatobacter sp.]
MVAKMTTLGLERPLVAPSGHRMLRRTLWVLGSVILIALCVMLFGSRLLIANDPVPNHVDAAVVLQGSIAAETARIAGAVRLLQSGASDRILVSIPHESYWGQSILPAASGFIEKNYGKDVADKTDFCETGPEVDSTRQEAYAVNACIQQRHWNMVAIVTSEYHTRRAGFLWRRAVRHSATQVWIDAVAEPDFQRQWWRGRRSAKIFTMEFLKLAWTLIAER